MPQKNPAQPAQPTFIEEVFAYAEITEHYAQSVDAKLVDQNAPPVLLLGEQMIEARVHDPETRISPTGFAGYIAVAMVQRAPERGYAVSLLRETLQVGDSGRQVEFRG